MTQWITLEEMGRYLKVSRAYLYKEVQAGRFPAVKVGRGWRFDRERVDDWLKTSQTLKESLYEFPWSDCLDHFLTKLQEEFRDRFASLWIYGSWARGEAREDSDIDLLVVFQSLKNFGKDFKQISSLAYDATFGRNRPFVFSITLTDQKTFLTGLEPLLLNIRQEGKKAA